MNNLTLTSAQVLSDGLVVRLRFEGGLAVGQPAINRRVDCGKFDYLPGRTVGKMASVNGQVAEIIGLQPEDWNMMLPWVEPPTTGGSIPGGQYVFLLAIADKYGNEIFTSPPIFGYSNEQGVAIPDQGQVTLSWRQPLAAGQTLRVYAATQSPVASNLSMVASYASEGATSFVLSSFGSFDRKWQPQSVCVTVTCLVRDVLPATMPVVISATEGLVADDRGFATEAIYEQPIQNQSLVAGTGFLATMAMQFSRIVYISSSYGSDESGDGSQERPFQTKGRADKEVGSDVRSVNFRFLRGDVFPYEPWKVANWGESRFRPTLYESYWNYSYGTDPGKRPVLMDSPELKPGSSWFQQGEHGKAYYGRWPYQYFRGLEFRRDPNLPISGNTWPTNTPQDSIVFSDCVFNNICLVPFGAPEHIAPIGCMFHRCLIQNASGSPTFEPHVSGIFIGHCGDWLFSQTAFVTNGWRSKDASANDEFNHNIYLSAMDRNVVFHSGWSINGCLSGLQLRGGGVVAYSVFSGNPSHLSSNDTHTFYKNTFNQVGIYNHIASGTHSFGCTAIHDYNITFGTNGLDQNRKAVNTFDGLYTFHHDTTGPYDYDAVMVRHETAINAGGISMGTTFPNRILDVRYNFILNEPGLGTDRNKHGLRSAIITQGRPQDCLPPSRVWDYNAYLPSGEKTDFCLNAQSLTFESWSAATDADKNSVVLTGPINFNSRPNVSNYIQSALAAICSRPANSWSAMYDGRYVYCDLANAYTPTNIPRASDRECFGAHRYPG